MPRANYRKNPKYGSGRFHVSEGILACNYYYPMTPIDLKHQFTIRFNPLPKGYEVLPGATNKVKDSFICASNKQPRRIWRSAVHYTGGWQNVDPVIKEIDDVVHNLPQDIGYDKFWKGFRGHVKDVLDDLVKGGEIQDYKMSFKKIMTCAWVTLTIVYPDGSISPEFKIKYITLGSKEYEGKKDGTTGNN
jgi:hypothetical protein